ncbi:hypothetical protein PC123_g24701 [Phytophthora cactorum]|nr:hypothetical protein PC120_g24400 [Phytophthora cactorum]KAG4039747.1 hypothetical protein PC123_g24701 [Phytophthora cactorum]
MIDVMGEKTVDIRVRVVKTAVRAAGEELTSATTVTTMQELHDRLGHIAYDTVERMADGQRSSKLPIMRSSPLNLSADRQTSE